MKLHVIEILCTVWWEEKFLLRGEVWIFSGTTQWHRAARSIAATPDG